MPQVLDRATGQPVDVPLDQAHAGLVSGQYALDADGPAVALGGKDGRVFTTSPDKVAGALATGAYRLLSPQEELRHKVAKEEAAKGIGGSLGEAFESGSNQLLFGLPETFTEAIESPQQKAEREARQEYHQTARVLGGAVGVAGSLLGGGEIFKAADLAGQAVERGILPAAELAEASLAHKLAATTANYAAQGVLYSSPQALIQGVVGGDWKKAGETMLWGVGLGALLGGGAKLLEEGGATLLGKAGEVLDREDVREALNRFANERTLKAVGAERSQLNKLSQERMNELADFIHDNGLLEPGQSRQELGDVIEKAHGQFGKSIGENVSSLDELAELPHDLDLAEIQAKDPWSEEKLAKVREARGRGETMDPVRVQPGDEGGYVLEDGIHRVAVARERGEKTIRASITNPESEHTFDALQEFIKPGQIGDALKTALDGPELRMPMNADQARALDTVIQSANQIPTTRINGRDVVSFTDAQAFVSSLRRRWSAPIEKALNEGGIKGPISVTPLDEMKQAAYQVARDAMHQAADRVAVAAQKPELVGRLASAKQSYAILSKLENFAATLDRQQAGNRLVSLTDFLHMGNGMVGGAVQAIGGGLGAAIGGPAGAVIGQQIAKVPAIALDFLAKKWMEDRGLVALSAIAKRAAKEGPEVFSAVLASDGAKRLEQSMGTVRDTVRALAMRGASEAGSSKPGDHMKHLLGDTTGLSHEQQHARLESRLTELATNPAALASATSSLSAPFSAASPELGSAYQKQLMDAVGYLYGAMPKRAAPPLPFGPDTFSPGRAESLAFRDKAEIVANPLSAMRHLARGTISDAHVEALKTVWPAVYGLMQQEILRFAGDHPDVKLPKAERESVARFMQMPLDGLEQHLASLQAAYDNAPAPQSNARSGTKRHPHAKMGKLPTMGSAFSSTQGPQWGDR